MRNISVDDENCNQQIASGGILDPSHLFVVQARLLAARAERGLPITSGSLMRLVQVGITLDLQLAVGKEAAK